MLVLVQVSSMNMQSLVATSAGARGRFPRAFAPQRTGFFEADANRHTALRGMRCVFFAWPQRFHPIGHVR
jgi:hypothetical protein